MLIEPPLNRPKNAVNFATSSQVRNKSQGVFITNGVKISASEGIAGVSVSPVTKLGADGAPPLAFQKRKRHEDMQRVREQQASEQKTLSTTARFDRVEQLKKSLPLPSNPQLQPLRPLVDRRNGSSSNSSSARVSL